MIRDVYFYIGTYIIFFQFLKREKWEEMNGTRENIEVMKNYNIYG
jgi:hypothetical protein